uniref:Secreted protein n=1 Tax=Steinernema glaseri TaxID=37863 RepID=A0A1I8AJT4_9BILA
MDVVHLFAAVLAVALAQDCGKYEELSPCLNSCDQICGQPPRKCSEICEDGQSCKCISGYCRDLNGACVPEEPECGVNEEESPCKNTCDQICGQPPRFCTDECIVGRACQCLPEYCRDCNGACILEGPQCGENEEKSPCKNTCDQICGGPPRACPLYCLLGHSCQCKPGYCRDRDGSCVPQPKCGPNEEVTPCKNTCDQVCGGPPRVCTLQCIFGHSCQCMPGFCRDCNGACVPEKPQCGENEEVSACKNTCDQYCGEPPRFCTQQCEIGHSCQCKPGYCRDSYGNCVATF